VLEVLSGFHPLIKTLGLDKLYKQTVVYKLNISRSIKKRMQLIRYFSWALM